ncbi:MAG: EthD family reductase [Xanthobacteraceae bacterium]
MAKIIFILQRRGDKSADDMRKHWSGEKHLSRIRQLPGLTRFTQNYIVASPGGHLCDGVGELWFADDKTIEKTLNSADMGAAVESAKEFLDMERTGLVIVEEKTVISV